MHKRRDQLVDIRQRVRTRQHEATDPDATADIADHIGWLSARIKQLEAVIAILVKATPELNQSSACCARSRGSGQLPPPP